MMVTFMSHASASCISHDLNTWAVMQRSKN